MSTVKLLGFLLYETAVTGHTAHTGHMRAMYTERESQVTHGDLDHGVRVHITLTLDHITSLFLAL